MLQIIHTNSFNHISAILTSACVSSTYEVESTKDIVQIWDEIRNAISLKDDMDFISAILATGRIMHGTSEMREPTGIMPIVDTFRSEIQRKSEGINFTQREYCAAFMASACVSKSDKIISAKNIVGLWKEIRSKIEVTDDYDLVSSILTSSRIADIRCQTEGLLAIKETFENVKSAVNQKVSHVNISDREIAAAHIAAAYIEITPKVEKIRDMVEAWMTINEQLLIKSEDDYIAAILASGRIKDLNAQHFMIPESINEIHSKILEYIKNTN